MNVLDPLTPRRPPTEFTSFVRRARMKLVVLAWDPYLRFVRYGVPVKTTIELPDDLAAQARRCAAESGTTLRSVIEEALRRELARRQHPVEWKADADLAYGSGGLSPTARSMSWAELRDLAMQR